MKSNEPENAMSTAVFELLAANPADVGFFSATPREKKALEKLVNGAVVCLG